MKKYLKPVQVDDNGDVNFNLATEAADDWIRAARLLKAGKLKEFEKMDNSPTHIEVDEGEEEEPNP